VTSIVEYLGNNRFLLSLYGDDLNFCNIDLQEIRFGWDGPIARLVFCLNQFPATPPQKWGGMNTVQVELSLFPLHEVNLTAFGRGNKCNLDIEPIENGEFIVTLVGESTATFKTMSVNVDKVSALLRQ
jgi:Immunity protein 50